MPSAKKIERSSLKSIYADPEVLQEAPDAVRIVLDHWHQSNEEIVDPLRDVWEEEYNAYRAYTEIDDDEIFSNFAVPAIWVHTESYVPRVVMNRPRIEVWENEPNDAALAAMHRALIYYNWRLLRMKFELVPYTKSALTYSTAIWKVRHLKRVSTRMFRQPVSQLEQLRLMLIEQERGVPFGSMPRPVDYLPRKVTSYDDPWLDPVDLDLFYPHPNSRDIGDNYPVVEERVVALSDLVAEAEANKDWYDREVVAEVEKRAREKNPLERYSGSHQTRLRERRLQTFGSERVPLLDQNTRQVTELTWTSPSQVISIIKEYPDLPPIVNKRNRIGEKNYVVFTPIPDPNRDFYGISLNEVLYSLQLESTTLHNARMDYFLGAIHPMFSVIRGSGLGPHSVRWGPWKMLEVDDHADLAPIQTPEIKGSIYREEQSIDRWMQAVGAPDPMVGLQNPAAARASATESQLIAQGSGAKAGLIYHIMSAQPLDRLGRLLIRINELFKTQEQRVRIVGRDMQPPVARQELRPGEVEPGVIGIDPNRLANGFQADPDLVVDVASEEPETRQFRLQRAIQAIQTAGQIPPEAWANPVIQRVGVQMLQGLGDEFAHETVQALAANVQSQQIVDQRTAEGGRSSSVVTPGQQIAADQGAGEAPGAGV